MGKGYKYAGQAMFILLLLVFVAFYKTYFEHFPDFKLKRSSLSQSKISIFDHLHVLLSLSWIGLLIVQPILIRSGKYKNHRLLGRASYVIFPLTILSCIQPINRIFQSDHEVLAYLPISDCVVLVFFYALAIYFKNDVAKHMRYMIGTAFVFLGPIAGRIGPNLFQIHPIMAIHICFFCVYLLVAVLLFFDRKHGRNYKPYLVILATLALKQLFIVMTY
ncbi:hypothetical protein [Jiulongibacter sp. NS-SX5]|uniref:hypothetical protein n=1 Tax=Jiulongibacter sp. NS-SX5 TaxID=3463854 RepID=UPI0040588C14